MFWTKLQYEELADKIFKTALEVQKQLGPGLLESVYVFALIKELELNGIRGQSQALVPLIYKGHDTGKQFFIDILVEDCFVIEVKASEGILSVHEAQLVSCLKLSDRKLGFLINFNVALIKDGFRRKVNNYFLEKIESNNQN